MKAIASWILTSALVACSAQVADEGGNADESPQVTDLAPTHVSILPIDETTMHVDWRNQAKTGRVAIEWRVVGEKQWTTASTLESKVGSPLPTSYVLTLVKPCAIVEVRAVSMQKAKTYPSKAASLSPSKNRMWIWPSVDGDLTIPSVRAAMIAWATSHSVDTLYVSAYQILNVNNDPVTLATFVNEAYLSGIGVMLAYGDPVWSDPAHWASAHSKIQTAVDFIRQQGAFASTGLPSSQRIGIVIDSEAWVSNWQGGVWSTVASDWLTMLSDLRTVTHGSATTNPNQLRFAVAIPSWLDTSATSCLPGPGCSVTWNAQVKLLSDHVIDLADGTVVMAYAQSASSIQSRATAEVARGSLRCKRQDVGIETACPVDASSFCGLTQTTMNAAMTSVRTGFSGQYGFGGIAIDRYGSWSAMTP